MSNIEKYEVAKDLVLSSQYDFEKLASIHGAVSFEKEASFATQALKNNSYLCGIAYSDPDSLKMAVINVAAIGLTLNPVRALAYLVPRDGRVSLDVSYRGYIALAIDSGAIQWAKSEVVHEKDEFLYNGMGREPTHGFNPFGERGSPVGAYCVVKTKSGDYLSEMMSIDDIFDIRNRSKAYQAYKRKGTSCPWTTDESEMIRKTVIRRAYKSWPIPSDSTKRLDDAMAATFEDHEIEVSPLTAGKVELLASISNKIELLGKDSSSEKFISFLSRMFNRQVSSVESLTEYELRKLEAMVDQWLEKQNIKMQDEILETEEERLGDDGPEGLELEDLDPELELETQDETKGLEEDGKDL